MESTVSLFGALILSGVSCALHHVQLKIVHENNISVCTKGYKSLTRAEVNHAPESYIYTMGILYGANFNMEDRTAGQLSRVDATCQQYLCEGL